MNHLAWIEYPITSVEDAEAEPAVVKTVGDLQLHAIGSTVITIEHEGATITGVISRIDLHTGPWIIERNLVGEATGSIPPTVKVDITIGQITLQSLHRSHPCEVIA